MITKKTALTMTDSERCFSEAYDPDLPEDFPKSLKDENSMLKIIVEEQKIALDMIMRKYREQIDRLTKLSQVDVRKLHYQRYLNTIVNQINKKDLMAQTMRKNVLVIFKYEELMREMEAENGRLRELVKSLSKGSENSKNTHRLKESLEVSCQTDALAGALVEDKAVGSDTAIDKKSPPKPVSESRNGCKEMVPYVSIRYDLADAVHKSSIHKPKVAELPYDEAYEVFLRRFTSCSMSGGLSNLGRLKTDAMVPDVPAIDSIDPELYEDTSEICIFSDAQSNEYDERSSACVKNDHHSQNNSKDTQAEEIFDDVQ